MAGEADSEYRFLGNGDGLALEVTGPTMESCLARAVEGFASAFADVHPSVLGRSHRVEVAASSPTGLLRGLLEASMRLGSQGELAIGLCNAELDEVCLRADLEAVPLSTARVVSAVPAMVCWHDISLERCDDNAGWVGRVVAGL